MSFSAAKEKMKNVGGSIKGATISASTTLGDKANNSVKTVSSGLTDIKDSVGNSSNEIMSSISNATGSVSEKMVNATDAVVGAPQRASDAIGEAVNSAAKEVSDTVDQLNATVDNKLTKTKDELSAATSSALNQVGAVALGGTYTAVATGLAYATMISIASPVAVPITIGCALISIFEGSLVTGALWVNATSEADDKRTQQKHKRALEALSKYKSIPECVSFKTAFIEVILSNKEQTLVARFIDGEHVGKDACELSTEELIAFAKQCSCNETSTVISRVIKNRA